MKKCFGISVQVVMQRMCWLVLCSTFASLAAGVPSGQQASQSEHGKRPVTVEDCIRMTKLADPGYWIGGSSLGRVAKFSPDKGKLVVVLRRGIADDNTDEYSLLLWETQELFKSPTPLTLLKMSSSSNREAIKDITWLADNESLIFIGEQPSELPQIYAFNVRTHSFKMLTNHPGGVASYSVTPSGDKIAFMALRPNEDIWNTGTRRMGFTFSGEYLWNVIRGQNTDREGSRGVYDLLSASSQGISGPYEVPGKIDNPPYGSGPLLSPDGKYILIATHPVATPQEWRQYSDPMDPDLQEMVRQRIPLGRYSYLRRYVLVDTSTGSSHILVNFPIGHGSKAVWLPDSHSIVVSRLNLPLTGENHRTSEVLNSKSFAAEINIETAKITKIPSDNLDLLGWDENLDALAFMPKGDASEDKAVRIIFKKKGDQWERLQDEIVSRASPDVRLKEDFHTRPRIVANDSTTGRSVMLMDLNPQFDALRFGRVEEIKWRGSDGREAHGGLYYPVGYERGKRYPLIIQTHGWYPDRFCIDGPWTTAFAAQPLAGAGFAVLQIQDPEEYLELTPEEAKRGVAIIEGAIDYLNGIGLADGERVGLIGFSRSGLQVRRALTSSKYHFAAASMTDSNDGGYFTYLAWNDLAPGWSESYERSNGGLPFGSALQAWTQNASGFKLEKVNTPVRLVALGAGGSLLGQWEWFAGLKRLGKAVEMTLIEHGEHIMQKPWDRMIDQQGNVDWFRFWLQGYEDPDPSKIEQYQRWRMLRTQRDRSSGN